MFATWAMAGLAGRPLQVGRRRSSFEAARSTKSGRMALQTLGIRLVLGRERIKRLCMLGRLPFHKLIEVARSALLRAHILLIRWWSRLLRCGRWYRLRPGWRCC